MSFRSLKLSTSSASLIALVLGLSLGLLTHASQSRSLLVLAGIVQPIGHVWLNLLRMTIVPLVVSMMLVAVGSTRNTSWAGRLAGMSMGVVISFMLLGVLVSMLIAPPAMAALGVDRTHVPHIAADTLEAKAGLARSASPEKSVSWADRITSMVPTNVVRAAANEELLPLLLFSFLFGLAISRLEPEKRTPFLAFIQAIADATLTMLRWILRLLPLGVFALGFSMALHTGPKVASLIGQYILIMSGVSLLVTLVLYPIAVAGGGVPLRRAIRAFAPAQLLAIGSRSSMACLPLMIDGVEQGLRVPPAISRLVLPLAVSGFKLSMAISAPIDLLYFSRIFDVPLGGLQLTGLIALMCVSSAALPAVAGGAPLGVDVAAFLAMGFPLETIVIREAGDTINDIFLTVLNVTANMTTTVVMARAGAPMLDPALAFQGPSAASVTSP